MQGMHLEDNGSPADAGKLFLQAWNEAANDFEKFIAAHYISRQQANVSEKLSWLETALQFALKVNNRAVTGAFPSLYANIAKCYEELGNTEKANQHFDLSSTLSNKPPDKGPFYHGTRASLEVGDLLSPGFGSNYKSELIMNHIYFTAMANGAGLAAALAGGDGAERVYIVEPTGSFENDPNVTDKKFPGNPTRSYRTREPLKIVGEITDWVKLTPEDIRKWREKLANSKGDIIN
jgi:rifampin ADP-ribosylating transferase